MFKRCLAASSSLLSPHLTNSPAALLQRMTMASLGSDAFLKPLHYLNGKRVEPSNDKDTIPVIEPATGKLLTNMKSSNTKDVDEAVASAKNAFGQWSQLSPFERGKIVSKAAQLLRKYKEEVAQIDVLDCGKPIWEARVDVEGCADTLEYFGGVAATLTANEEQMRNAKLNVLPAIDDNGFILTECDAILKYLCSRFNVTEHWYPTDIQLRALVDEFCTWNNMRIHICASAIYNHQILEPRFKNIPVDRERLRRFQVELERALDKMETVFLNETDFVCSNEITIADVLCVCELMQSIIAGQVVTQSRPKLAAWLERVKERLQPHFDDIHTAIHDAKANSVGIFRCASFDY